jgi:hypothetical protein
MMITLSARHFWIAFFSVLCGCSPAMAIDPACKSLLGAMEGLKNRPFHLYMTTEDKFSSATLARAAASIDMAGIKKSEEIWTGKDIFVLTKDKWIDMHTNFAAMGGDSGDDPDAKKARDAQRCTILADQIVDGQPVGVVQTHNPELGTDGKFWISKTSHLPIRSETTTDTGAMKRFMSSRYTYDNVQAPSHAVSLSDTVRK